NDVSILLGNGDGTFQAATSLPVPGSNPLGVTLGDLNKDGHLDIIVAEAGSSDIAVFLGQGGGAFAAPVTYALATPPFQVVVADVNGDGKLDVVTANPSNPPPTDTLSVLLQR